jgi:hypothetical protein
MTFFDNRHARPSRAAGRSPSTILLCKVAGDTSASLAASRTPIVSSSLGETTGTVIALRIPSSEAALLTPHQYDEKALWENALQQRANDRAMTMISVVIIGIQ